MSAELDRLTASIGALSTSVDTAVAEIGTLTAGSVSPAALTALADQVDAAKAKLDAAAPPPV